MSEFKLEGLKPVVSERIRPFLEDVFRVFGQNIHSCYVVGSAATEDFDPGLSDINSIVVLGGMDFGSLRELAPLGKKYGKRKISAPLIMTREYILSSLDVFPVEFLSYRLVHETVYGDDMMKGVEIHPGPLRLQIERELKARLVGLERGYISGLGNPKAVSDALAASAKGYMPLFRGIITLYGDEPPVLWADVLSRLSGATGLDCGVFDRARSLRMKGTRLPVAALTEMFEELYRDTEKLVRIVDEIKV